MHTTNIYIFFKYTDESANYKSAHKVNLQTIKLLNYFHGTEQLNKKKQF